MCRTFEQHFLEKISYSKYNILETTQTAFLGKSGSRSAARAAISLPWSVNY